MINKSFIIGLVFILIATGCARPAADIGETAEVSPSQEQVRETEEDAVSDTTPEAGEEDKGESSQALSSLENNMDILIEAGNTIGSDHYADLQDSVKALEGSITPADQARLEEKLSELAVLSGRQEGDAGQEEETAQEPETGQAEPETVPPADYEP
ncbi:MAG: hypothetical protein V3S02_00190, partial [Dehalococcoidales bacterium]